MYFNSAHVVGSGSDVVINNLLVERRWTRPQPPPVLGDPIKRLKDFNTVKQELAAREQVATSGRRSASLAVQVKHFLNPLRFHAGRWEYKAGRRWRWMNKSHDPAKVAGQAQRLSEYLAKNGITRWVEKAIALAESVPEKNVTDSLGPVWLPFTTERHARALSTRTPPSRAEVEQINALLARRADEQRAVEADRQKRNRA